MIEVRHLTRKFRELVAVNDVSFQVRPGEFTGFVGGNGAGKTTTMRMMMGTLASNGGEVLWQGRPITRGDRAQLGYMPEERGLYPKQPVLRQLAYFGELHGMQPQQARQQAMLLLERFGLVKRAKDKLEKLSLGNQQRVQIAASVIAQPIGLILDEPFSGLDPDAVDQMHGLLSEFAKAGVPILFSSHQLDLVERLCDHIIILSDGQVVADGTVSELRASRDDVHRIKTDSDVGWLREFPGVHVIDLDGAEAQVTFTDDEVAQHVLEHAMSAGPVRAFGPVVRPLSHIYREVTQ
ncbi:MAG: ABC transporter ATP-binding protein [Arachnia sp.]